MDDEDYRDLKEQLQSKRDTLHRRIREIRSDLQQEDKPLEKDLEDQAIELENDEVLNRLEPATRQELADTLAALERMEEGTYGQCVECGDEISVSRLKALPYALKCIQCAEEAEMSSRQ
jgi:RNA polymerase-binding protein DksA